VNPRVQHFASKASKPYSHKLKSAGKVDTLAYYEFTTVKVL
jgi:hypothetical protein